MKTTRVLTGGAALLMAASALAGCGTKATSADPMGQYEAKKGEIPSMVKNFSGPNLGVLLSGAEIGGLSPKVIDAETVGTMRLADQQGTELIQAATFDPANCQQKLLETYKDNSELPAAFSQGVSAGNATTIRVQLRSHPAVEEAGEPSQTQQALAETCPSYTVTVPGTDGKAGEVTQFKMSAEAFPLEGATDGLMTTLTASPSGGSSFTEVGIFQRVGNLDLRVYFDGEEPEKDAAAAKADLQNLVTHLGQALVAKG